MRPLPVHVEGNPRLKRFILARPADLASNDRAALHGDIAKRLELGERTMLDENRCAEQHDRAMTFEGSNDR